MSWRGIGRAVAALTVGFGLLTGAAAAQENPLAGAVNRALVDADRTAEVLDRTEEAAEALFTYDYRDPAGHRKTFDELTTGSFADRYSELFDATLAQAVEQQYSLSSAVANAGVRVLTKGEAEVLVFLDQTGTRGDTNQQSQGNAMFLATMRQDDGDWKVADMDLFEGQ